VSHGQGATRRSNLTLRPLLIYYQFRGAWLEGRLISTGLTTRCACAGKSLDHAKAMTTALHQVGVLTNDLCVCEVAVESLHATMAIGSR
jgi:hypothetical protein